MGKRRRYQVFIRLGSRPWRFVAGYFKKEKAELVAASYRMLRGAVDGEPFHSEVRERKDTPA